MLPSGTLFYCYGRADAIETGQTVQGDGNVTWKIDDLRKGECPMDFIGLRHKHSGKVMRFASAGVEEIIHIVLPVYPALEFPPEVKTANIMLLWPGLVSGPRLFDFFFKGEPVKGFHAMGLEIAGILNHEVVSCPDGFILALKDLSAAAVKLFNDHYAKTHALPCDGYTLISQTMEGHQLLGRNLRMRGTSASMEILRKGNGFRGLPGRFCTVTWASHDKEPQFHGLKKYGRCSLSRWLNGRRGDEIFSGPALRYIAARRCVKLMPDLSL